MKSKLFQRLYEAVVNPEPDEASLLPDSLPTPTLWLLGKTGAGKSSLIEALTQAPDIEVGNGFQPCTRTAQIYYHPEAHPVVAFLDSRGLDEVDYDPADDLIYCADKSHAIVIVVALDDPDQQSVIDTVKPILAKNRHRGCMVVFSRKSFVAASDVERVSQYVVGQLQRSTGVRLPYVCYDRFETESLQQLRETLADQLPEIHLWLLSQQAKDAESRRFHKYRSEIIWYASAAAASDTLPGIGLFTVPGVQGKLLHALGRRYGVSWDRERLSAFSSALGAGMLLRFGGQLGGRQLAKLIPGIGQTIGSAAAAVVSFSTTYALGRVACYYLYQTHHALPVDPESLQVIYRQALSEAKTYRDQAPSPEE
uniref:YcjF family protein n=1 Tax=Thaumasiovibrio occultus TaxID=1891184 RepID=UPI000B34D0AB|nr:GTPase [Thaumasiovibrio occultus]